MQGLHLIADLRLLCLQAVGDLFHCFPAPGGITGMVTTVHKPKR